MHMLVMEGYLLSTIIILYQVSLLIFLIIDDIMIVKKNIVTLTNVFVNYIPVNIY